VPLTSPSQPTEQAIAELCESSGFMSIGIASALLVVGLLVGWLVGFLMGRKSKGKKKKEKSSGATAAELSKALGVAADQVEAFEKHEADDDDDDEDESPAAKLEREFLSMMADPGLDHHPDLQINPIILYKIKLAKEEDRIEKLLESLLEAARDEPPEGVTLPTPEELAGMSAQEKASLAAAMQNSGTVARVTSGVGSVAGKSRRYAQGTNATRLLVNAGATLSFAGQQVSREGAEETAAKELRERLRVIDQHMQHRLKVDTSKTDPKGWKTKLGPRGVVVDAYQMAKDTKEEPYGGAAMKRSAMTAVYASRGRKRVGIPLDHMLRENFAQKQGGVRRESLSQQTLGRKASVTGGFQPPNKRPDTE